MELRLNKKAVEFAQQFLETGKPVAAICHGPQLLITKPGAALTATPGVIS